MSGPPPVTASAAVPSTVDTAEEATRADAPAEQSTHTEVKMGTEKKDAEAAPASAQLAVPAASSSSLAVPPSSSTPGSRRTSFTSPSADAIISADLAQKQHAVKVKEEHAQLAFAKEEALTKLKRQEEAHQFELTALKMRLQLEYEKELEAQELRLRKQQEAEAKEQQLRHDIQLGKQERVHRLSFMAAAGQTNLLAPPPSSAAPSSATGAPPAAKLAAYTTPSGFTLPAGDPFASLTPAEQLEAYTVQAEHLQQVQGLFDEATHYMVDKEAKLVEIIETLNKTNADLYTRLQQLEDENFDLTHALNAAHAANEGLDESRALSEAARVESIKDHREAIEKLVEEMEALERENRTNQMLLAAVPALTDTKTATPAANGGPTIDSLQATNTSLEAKVTKLQIQLSSFLAEQDRPAFSGPGLDEYDAPRSPPGQQRLFSSGPYDLPKSIPAVVTAAASTDPVKVEINVLIAPNSEIIPPPASSIADTSSSSSSSASSTVSSTATAADSAALSQHVHDLTTILADLRSKLSEQEEQLKEKTHEVERLREKAQHPPNALQSELNRAAEPVDDTKLVVLTVQLYSVQAQLDLANETAKAAGEAAETERQHAVKAAELASKQHSELNQKYSILLTEFQSTLAHAEATDAEYKAAIVALQKHYEEQLEELHGKHAAELAAAMEEANETGEGGAAAGKKRVAPKDEVEAKSAGNPAASTSETEAASASEAQELMSHMAQEMVKRDKALEQANGKLVVTQKLLDATSAELTTLKASVAANALELSTLKASVSSTAADQQPLIQRAEIAERKVDELQTKLDAAEKALREADAAATKRAAVQHEAAAAAHQVQIVDLRTRLERAELAALSARVSATASEGSSPPSSSQAPSTADAIAARDALHSSRMADLLSSHSDELSELKRAHSQKLSGLEARYQARQEAERTEQQEERKEKERMHAKAIDKLNAEHQQTVKDLQAEHALALAQMEKQHALTTSSLQAQAQHAAAAHELALSTAALKASADLAAAQLASEHAHLEATRTKDSAVQKAKSELQAAQIALEAAHTDNAALSEQLKQSTRARRDLESQLSSLSHDVSSREKQVRLGKELELDEVQAQVAKQERETEQWKKSVEEIRAEMQVKEAQHQQAILTTEQALAEARALIATMQAAASTAALNYTRQLAEATSRADSAVQAQSSVESKLSAAEATIAEQKLELADLRRVRKERESSTAESVGAATTIVREDDSVLDSLSKEDLLTKYQALRVSFDAHVNQADEMHAVQTTKFERELAALQAQQKTQDAQYTSAITSLREKHTSELAVLTALHTKLAVEAEAANKAAAREKAALEEAMRKLANDGALAASRSASRANSRQNSPRNSISGPSGGAAGQQQISAAHSLLLTEYQSLYQNYTALSSSHAKLQSSVDAYQTKLDSAKKLVIALNNERKELLSYKQRKRAENEKLRAECKQFYAAYVEASQLHASLVSSPLASPSPLSSPQASPPATSRDAEQLQAAAALLSPSIVKMMQEGEKRNETAAPVPAEPTSVPDAAVVATPVKEKAAENGVHTNGIAE